uniref:Double-strand-break repair protein rad21 homolog n=1 Tax=Syphacia muris TaxID=451379 RepID=A0A0N5AXI1_9BILA
MFYAQFVLSKKGPLAKIWLAAHWEKKLSKAQIYETNVQDAVDEILKPKVKMALRTTGHLLLGIVRIYSRKAKYLLADCNEAFLKLKMAFRPGQAELSEDGQQVDSSAINLPEVFHDFDSVLPDFNELDFETHMHINQSRIDDITLKEDIIPESTDLGFGGDFGGDDFGESLLGYVSDAEVEGARERVSDALGDLNMASKSITLEEDDINKSIDGKVADIDLSESIAIPDAVDDFGDFGADNMLDDVVFNENELTKSLDAIEAPGIEHEAPMETDEIAGGAMPGLQITPSANGVVMTESFALEPLDASAIAIAGMEKAARPKRRRRLIVDEQKNISGDEMKANMANFRDTLQPLDLAPPTKQLMRLREMSSAEKLYSNPGCCALRAPVLLKLYRSHLVPRARAAVSLSNDDVRRDLEMTEHVDANIEPEGSVASGIMEDHVDDFDDVAGGLSPLAGSPVPLEPIAEEESTSAQADDSPSTTAKDLFAGPERKRERRSRVDRTGEEEDTTVEGGEDDHRWSKRTQNVLNSISSKIKSSAEGQIVLSDLLTKNSTRKTAAQKFYTLLVLKKWQAVEVHQTEPFGDISISAGPNITGTVAT